jgi:hypothetical protein
MEGLVETYFGTGMLYANPPIDVIRPCLLPEMGFQSQRVRCAHPHGTRCSRAVKSRMLCTCWHRCNSVRTISVTVAFSCVRISSAWWACSYREVALSGAGQAWHGDVDRSAWAISATSPGQRGACLGGQVRHDADSRPSTTFMPSCKKPWLCPHSQDAQQSICACLSLLCIRAARHT